ncbi:MAG: hypothetical protein L6U99_04680 [Clostridium sp.]|nr:MAG: hypothetical protein L6U99_04680 [Clostridium sp.]
MSNRGLAGVFNLHCRQFIDAVADALPSTIAKLTTKKFRNDDCFYNWNKCYF